MDKYDGGEWYEPYVANKDVIMSIIIAMITSGFIGFGLWLLDKYRV